MRKQLKAILISREQVGFHQKTRFSSHFHCAPVQMQQNWYDDKNISVKTGRAAAYDMSGLTRLFGAHCGLAPGSRLQPPPQQLSRAHIPTPVRLLLLLLRFLTFYYSLFSFFRYASRRETYCSRTAPPYSLPPSFQLVSSCPLPPHAHLSNSYEGSFAK